MLLEGKAGPLALGDGAAAALRLDRAGGLVMAPRYRELVRRGLVYGAVTAVTGVAPGTVIGTTAAFDLWNPSGSPVRLELVRVGMAYVSGTLGAGVVEYITHVRSEVAHTGTAIVPINALNFSQGAAGKAFTTATVPANGLAIREFCSLGASLATTAVQPWQIFDRVEGEIIVSEGCGVSLQATAAAGTSPLVVFSVLWAEIPADL